jgi:hypothetical protein
VYEPSYDTISTLSQEDTRVPCGRFYTPEGAEVCVSVVNAMRDGLKLTDEGLGILLAQQPDDGARGRLIGALAAARVIDGLQVVRQVCLRPSLAEGA